MDASADVDFVVGENYENEKGVFTVLSIQRNEMVIRWENGEEISTDIELQRNIQARRQWEKQQRENEAKAAKRSAKSGSRAQPEFNGFQAGDFKNSASGTKWRGRAHLGGAVTRKLPDDRFRINSWAFANKPELHWLDMSHRKREGADSGARFVARVDRMSLLFGFSIIRPDEKDGKPTDWDAFTEWLGHDESEKLLHELALDRDLRILERTTSASTELQPDKSGWRTDDATFKTAEEFVGQLPSTGLLHLEFVKRIDKIDTVARGKEIADDIAALIKAMMPIYQAVLGRLV